MQEHVFELAHAAAAITLPDHDRSIALADARAALSLGSRVLRHGRSLPLAVLLDLPLLVMDPHRRRKPESDGRSYTERIMAIAVRIREALGVEYHTQVGRPDLLPFLLELGSDHMPASLAPLPQPNDVVNAWRTPLEGSLSLAESRSDATALAVLATWSRITSAAPELADVAPERLDLRALACFAEGRGLPIPASERQRSLRLRTVSSRRSVPYWEALEEMDPHYGAIALATLLLGEEGERQIVERAGPKLGQPHTRAEPPRLEVHVGVGVGAAGAAHGSSGLLALTALLLNDLRHLLSGITAEYYVHRIGTRPGAAFAARSSTDFWKLPSGTLDSNGRSFASSASTLHLPNSKATRLLFERAVCVPAPIVCPGQPERLAAPVVSALQQAPEKLRKKINVTRMDAGRRKTIAIRLVLALDTDRSELERPIESFNGQAFWFEPGTDAADGSGVQLTPLGGARTGRDPWLEEFRLEALRSALRWQKPASQQAQSPHQAAQP